MGDREFGLVRWNDAELETVKVPGPRVEHGVGDVGTARAVGENRNAGLRVWKKPVLATPAPVAGTVGDDPTAEQGRDVEADAERRALHAIERFGRERSIRLTEYEKQEPGEIIDGRLQAAAGFEDVRDRFDWATALVRYCGVFVHVRPAIRTSMHAERFEDLASHERREGPFRGRRHQELHDAVAPAGVVELVGRVTHGDRCASRVTVEFFGERGISVPTM